MIHSIAAGEVIDSLAAAVRELIENALDAQATHITLALWPDQGRVQVADNGTAMALENLLQAAIPHSTSKIRTQADLWRVASLGFRGEALHSLAQVAQLEICSRPPQAESGWRVTYSATGEPLETTPAALAQGTVVTVTDLFKDWPARRERLPTLPRQLTQVQRVIYHCALAHPTVTWVVQVGDRPWLSLTPSPTARGLVPQLVRAVNESDLHEGWQPVSWAEGNDDSLNSLQASIYGLIGLPDRCHRPRPDWVKVAVNGRLVTVPELEQSIVNAFRYTLPRHRYPLGLCAVDRRPQRHRTGTAVPTKAPFTCISSTSGRRSAKATLRCCWASRPPPGPPPAAAARYPAAANGGTQRSLRRCRSLRSAALPRTGGWVTGDRPDPQPLYFGRAARWPVPDRAAHCPRAGAL